MPTYDDRIIRKFAERLYSRANSIIALYTLLGIVAGGAAGYGVNSYLHIGTPFLVGLLVGAVLGFALGREKAFELKLQAQVALCQVQIEQNTRDGAA